MQPQLEEPTFLADPRQQIQRQILDEFKSQWRVWNDDVKGLVAAAEAMLTTSDVATKDLAHKVWRAEWGGGGGGGGRGVDAKGGVAGRVGAGR